MGNKHISCDIDGDGWKFYGFDPPQQQMYPKYNYNIFSNERLSHDLIERDIKTLIITGVATQICVETAIRNGFDIGYKIVVPEDLVATTSDDPEMHTHTFKLLRKTYGTVSNLEEVVTTLNSNK